MVTYGIIGLIVFRVTIIVVGAIFAFLGYRLFKLGYFEKAGELQAAWGTKHLVLKQVAPGVFFALFGAVIIAIGTWKPLSFGSDSPATQTSIPNNVADVLWSFVQNSEVTADQKALLKTWLQRQAGDQQHTILWGKSVRPLGLDKE